MAGASVIVPPGTASAGVAAITTATSTAVAAIASAATAVARAVVVGGLGHQTIGVLRGCWPEHAVRHFWARLGASQRASTATVSSCVKTKSRRSAV